MAAFDDPDPLGTPAWLEGPVRQYEEAHGDWTDQMDADLDRAVQERNAKYLPTRYLRGHLNFQCPLCQEDVAQFEEEAVVEAAYGESFMHRRHAGRSVIRLSPCGHIYRRKPRD